jgi:hypothetical protein
MTNVTDHAAKPRPFKWGFLSAALTVLALIVAGQIVGTMIEGFGPKPEEAKSHSFGGYVAALGLKDWIFLGFVLSSLTFAFLQREAIVRFFRTMQVGVVLVSLSLLAVMAGVLVPQITGFEDPTERVPSIRDIPDDTFYAYLKGPDEEEQLLPADSKAVEKTLTGLNADQRARLRKYRAEYQTFRWAEGYFIYHLIHPYGIGMPSAMLPAPALEKLKLFGLKYGEEERANREKTMKAAFGGREKSVAIGTLIRGHEAGFRGFFDVATTLQLNRAYKSHWFATLLGLLCIGVAFNTFKGQYTSWLSARKVGYVVVHLGVMTLLIGGAYSKVKTERGILHLDLRDPPTNKFLGYYDAKKPRWMPFSLKLERFARRDWKTLEVGFPEENFASMPPQYTLWPERKVELDYVQDEKTGQHRPQIALRVVNLSERAHVDASTFVEAGSEPNGYAVGPLATLSISKAPTDGAGAANDEILQLSPLMRERKVFYDPAWRFRLLVDFGDDLAAAQKTLADVGGDRIGWLSMRVGARGDAAPTRVPIQVGAHVAGPGGYTIDVVRAAPAFSLDRTNHKEVVDSRPLDQQFPSNPAVVLRITPGDGGQPEERTILERLDYEEAGLQTGCKYAELVVNLDWDRWSAPGPERFALHWDSKLRAHLLSASGSAVAVDLSKPLDLPGSTKVATRELFANARLERQIHLDTNAPVIQGPHFDESFYATDPTGVELEVTMNPGTPAQRVEHVKLASTDEGFANEWLSPDKRFYVRFYNNDKVFPFEWRSVLSVWEKDADGNLYKKDVGPEWDREIRVNDYFYYRGYRFFQTNADPKFPTYSGIGVVYDPGIPAVLVGMYLTIIGAILAFVVRPIAESYGKRKKLEVRS